MKSLQLFLFVFIYLSPLPAQEFIVTTLPKTGSHLLLPFLEAITGKERAWIPNDFYYRDCSEKKFNRLLNHPEYAPVYLHRQPLRLRVIEHVLDRYQAENLFWASHIPYSPSFEKLIAKRNLKVFHIKRDPRDFVVSAAHYYGTHTCCPFNYSWYSRLSFEEQLYVMIVGTTWWNSAKWHLKAFQGWLKCENCCVIQFEKFMGPNGGKCSEEEHRQELIKIARFINCDLSEEDLLAIFDSVYGSGPTFRRGKCGEWKEAFNERILEVFDSELGSFLESKSLPN